VISITKETYDKITRSLRKSPQKVKALKGLNKGLTLLVYFMYPTLLLVLGYQHDDRFWRVLITPGVSFVMVSIFRYYLNFQRPYEVLDIVPIIYKDTKGKSFPSRHIFSVFVIAMVFSYISLPMGMVLIIIGIFLAVVRVIGGVHFPKDVIAGGIIGILSGIVGLYLV